MTNFEYWKDEILAILNTGESVGVNKKEDRPVDCYNHDCNNCILNIDMNGGCSELWFFQWLCSEHVEKPKISKRTKSFLEALQTGWIARDRCGKLVWFGNKPYKGIDVWLDGVDGAFKAPLTWFRFLTLDFITWDDDKPWRIEDLLKLETLEEE